jgi:hypothetical protein
LICTDHMSGFMKPGKSSSLVTTLSNHTLCFKVVCWRENEVTQDDGRAGRSLGGKTSSREEGPNFNLVGTLWTVVVRETHGPHVRHVVRFFPVGCTLIQITATLSNMSECLLIDVISLYVLLYFGWIC